MILLDSHAWIWMHAATERLGANSREVLCGSTPIGISAVTIYEALIALERKRVVSDMTPQETVERWLAAAPARVFPATQQVVVHARSLSFGHADPFDRMIAATAYCEQIPLLTADLELLELDWLQTIKV